MRDKQAMAPLSRDMYRSVRGTCRVEGRVHVAGGERHTIKNFICRMLQRVSGLSGKGSEQSVILEESEPR